MFWRNNKPKKERPIPKSQYGTGSIDNSRLDKLTRDMELPIHGLSDIKLYKLHAELQIMTKDEFIIKLVTESKMNKKTAIEAFEKIAGNYNFIFKAEGSNYYSVDYINKLLER